jgi:hypothetical protein
MRDSVLIWIILISAAMPRRESSSSVPEPPCRVSGTPAVSFISSANSWTAFSAQNYDATQKAPKVSGRRHHKHSEDFDREMVSWRFIHLSPCAKVQPPHEANSSARKNSQKKMQKQDASKSLASQLELPSDDPGEESWSCRQCRNKQVVVSRIREAAAFSPLRERVGSPYPLFDRVP